MKMPIKNLGTRICIIGPSNSGKSTLANRLSKKIGCNACHLDQLAHEENTNWKRRPNDDFISDHNNVIAKDMWVIDGNYSICMPQRFERSTAVIWIDPPLFGFLWRYVKRSIKNNDDREGNLKGATSQFSWSLIKYTLFNYPRNCQKYKNLLQRYKNPIVKINSMKKLNSYYSEWGIQFKE